MTTWLVTGVSGLLGGWVASRAKQQQIAIAGTSCFGQGAAPEGIACDRLDLTNPEAIFDTVGRLLPDLIVHCAAHTDVDACEKSPYSAWAVNTDGTRHLALAARQAKSGLIYISTDYVFSGEKGDYTEDDPPDPINWYGRTKLGGEWSALCAYPETTVIRTTFFGRRPGRSGWTDRLADRLAAGNSVVLPQHRFFSPIFVGDLADLIISLALVHKAVAGQILNLAGRTRCSRFEFGRLLAEAMGFDPDLIRPGTAGNQPGQAPRPADSSLCTEKAGITVKQPIPDLKQTLHRFAKESRMT